MKNKIFLSLALSGLISFACAQEDDAYQWLEEVDGKKPLEFVEQHNKKSLEKLTAQASYQKIYDKSLEIYNSSDRIEFPSIQGQFIYNFWQDKDHPRGIWRRTSKEKYLAGNPAWETLLDIDAMSKADGVLYVYKGSTGLHPTYDKFLVRLSKGGGDAVIVREFDPNKKEFIQGGFELPESKCNIDYLDANTMIVGTDFGDKSMTTSGYPNQVRLWKKGTPLTGARLIYEGQPTDVSSSGFYMPDGDKGYLMVQRGMTFYTSQSFVWLNDKLVKLDIPEDADINALQKDQLLVALKSDLQLDGKKYKSGSLLSYDFTALTKGQKKVILLFEPDQFTSITGVSTTKNNIILDVLSNVKSELYICSFANGKWDRQRVNAPDFGTIYLTSADDFSDVYFFTYTNFLTPTTLYQANAGANSVKAHKSLPAYFDAAKYKVEQHKAKSKDGTMVPYFVVSASNVQLNGSNPTLLYAYGGFEVPMLPGYSAIVGNAWLDNGGVYVLANIRGGGEFGPKWHQAGLKEKRQNVYNDFHAIAEELITKKITSSKHLGIMGGSNGGLLMGVAFTQRPDLYNAVVCQVPLLDMRRYNKLLAGASWMAEYGDPDKADEWKYISTYSPYQNVKKDVKYPEVFFTTSTRDDRVHPGHARKMVARMTDMGHNVLYFENTEGGHAGASTNEQRAKTAALQYSYLLMKLKS
jgi:prolyl oligopeptidase